jgi:peptidoglycan-associated lipoprotein
MRPGSGMRLLCTVGILVGTLGLFGCPKRPVVVQAPPTPVGPAAMTTPASPVPEPPPAQVVPPETPVVQVAPLAALPVPQPAPAAPVPAAKRSADFKDVFFDFDRSNLRADQQELMAANIAWLKANAMTQIILEGHCDERGTAEYNISLGERRARVVRDALVKGGIAAARISVISYGEERPFVLGHDESAWKWNRRAHFVLGK